ncbi:MAG: low molecular weight protein-tyrosine-phosphatase [Acidimicrobiales bacterium]
MKICFVCMGNICRSPTAEGIMRAKLDALPAGTAGFELDSAGTGGWHRGEPADERARAEARRHGVELTSRARQVHAGDFAYFDLLVAMDRANHADLLDLAPDAEAASRVRLLLEFAPGIEPADLGDPRLDVPDPYYGGPTGFADVFDLIDAACDGLLAHLTDGSGRPVSPATPETPEMPEMPTERRGAPGS